MGTKTAESKMTVFKPITLKESREALHSSIEEEDRLFFLKMDNLLRKVMKESKAGD